MGAVDLVSQGRIDCAHLWYNYRCDSRVSSRTACESRYGSTCEFSISHMPSRVDPPDNDIGDKTMTSDPLVQQLAKELEAAGHTVGVNEADTIFVENDVFDILISERLGHPDRGRWLCCVRPLDKAEMFPRYFFHHTCLVRELTTWLEVRMRKLEAGQ